MEQKEQFQKILEWMKQISRTMATKADLQDVEKKLTFRLNSLDESFDDLALTVQTLLKAIRKVRVDQYNDRTNFQKEIQKMRQEIREIMH